MDQELKEIVARIRKKTIANARLKIEIWNIRSKKVATMLNQVTDKQILTTPVKN